MISFDSNIVVHSANADSPDYDAARRFMESIGTRGDVVLCELMLVELFLKLCNERVFRRPMAPAQAGAYCTSLRANRNWRLVESAPVMADVWEWPHKRGFAFRGLIDIRLGLTLRHCGVDEFATTNGKSFRGLGFRRIWNPLAEGRPS